MQTYMFFCLFLRVIIKIKKMNKNNKNNVLLFLNDNVDEECA